MLARAVRLRAGDRNSDRTRVGPIAEPANGRLLPTFASIVLWLLAAAIVAGWIALAAGHLADDYRLSHMHGVWIAAAEAARNGVLYPPLFDGERYAGTRYMPLPILLNALAANAVGDPLIGGKLLAAVLMATLLVLVLIVLRRVSCPWPLAAALAAVVVATDTGLQAGTSIGGDVLPVVLQLGALSVALRGRNQWSMLMAGAFAGLAIASKLTGFWAALAIVTWLTFMREWRAAGAFGLACAATAGLVLGAVQLFTGGGLSEHIVTFAMAGVHGTMSWLRAPNQFLFHIRGHAVAAVVLLPMAALGALLATSWRHLSLIHLAFGYALMLLLVVYTDIGTGFNQLLDTVVLTVLAAGYLAGCASRNADRSDRVIALAVAVTVAWAASLDLVRTVLFDVRTESPLVSAGERPTRMNAIVAAMVGPGQEVLTADASIDVALGRRPFVMDPFMLTRLDRTHPEWVDPLISSILRRRFALVVLVAPLEDPASDAWYTDYHFGPRIAAALRDAYRADARVGRYYLYRPVQ